MAVRRDPAAIAFPPLKTTAEIQKSLPPGHALLVFFATSRNLYAFLLSHEKYANWQVASTPQVLARQSATLLREIGNISPNYELSSKDLADGKWRQTARELLDGLLKGSQADFATKFDELIIVPDGLLWYVPFEALQVQVDGQSRSLISRFRIRYAPTAGLATATVGPGPPPRQHGDRRRQTQSQIGRRGGREHGQGPVEIAARLRDVEDALAGLGPDLRQFHRPPSRAGRVEPSRRDRSLRLVAASYRADQDQRAAGRVVPAAAAGAGRSDPAGLSLGVRKFAEEGRCRAPHGSWRRPMRSGPATRSSSASAG